MFNSSYFNLRSAYKTLTFARASSKASYFGLTSFITYSYSHIAITHLHNPSQATDAFLILFGLKSFLRFSI